MALDNLFVSGDEEGIIQLWDARINTREAAVSASKVHEDLITGFLWLPNKQQNLLLATSADGSMSALDFRFCKRTTATSKASTSAVKKRRKTDIAEESSSTLMLHTHSKSEAEESEFLCLRSLKDGKEIIVGAEDGSLLIYNSDLFLSEASSATSITTFEHNDKFGGHPHSVDHMVKIDEDTILTASSDGILRFVSIQPNKLVGALDVSKEHDNMPIEGLELSSAKSFIATTSHDKLIRLFDLRSFLGGDGHEDEEVDEDGSLPQDSDNEDEPFNTRNKQKSLQDILTKSTARKQDDNDFFADM